MKFKLVSDYTPCGDQPGAINALADGIQNGNAHQVLLGVTGSGKTYTVANVIERIQRPALILAPNKTLAAQLYAEFKELFPENAVEYFVSYYDYYQPEAYVPSSDTYIEKDSSINEEIDRLRHAATSSLLQRQDVIVVASISCIYGLGSPVDYKQMLVLIQDRTDIQRDDLLRALVDIQYERNDVDFHRGTFRVRGDVVEIFPAYEEQCALRVEFFGDTIDSISRIDALTGRVQQRLSHIHIELKGQVALFEAEGKLIEAQRIREKTTFDLEMMATMGYCNGIENYSRHLDGRKEGEPPSVLLDYFPKDFMVFIDESHIGVSQIRAMYNGDRSRKKTLVNYGFRLPSALDNRPLQFDEFNAKVRQIVYISATPAEYELQLAGGRVVEDLLEEIRRQVEKGDRTLVTTLTKRMSEDLTEYYKELGVRVEYLHSDVKTLERIEIIRKLRLGEFDVLIGINLLREGLDLPEVSLVAILDADKEGFLRSERSLIQTCGRAARNVDGRVILYADVMTRSINATMQETDRRRALQKQYNREHNITPATIKKSINSILSTVYEKDYVTIPLAAESHVSYHSLKELQSEMKKLKKQMLAAARELEFEKAAEIRDRLHVLEKEALELTG
jgi:excinuclease ABC subunit B